MSPGDYAPDYDRGYLRVPLSVWMELYCRAPLTRRQLQLVSVVIRESWGWQTKDGQVYLWTRPLPPRQLATATGLSTDHLARDLKALVTRGVVREQAGRYQLVPDLRLWKSLPPHALKRRSPALKAPVQRAKTTLFASGPKKANKVQRNVRLPTRSELSPVADNSPVLSEASPDDRSREEETLGRERRFVQVLEAYGGALPVEQAEQLRHWLRQDGITVVWQALQPAFRRGPTGFRAALEARLRDRLAAEMVEGSAL
jgi:hypothetical protein